MRARRLVVSGRVQGVFFRDCTRREATRLGVAGWVRNRPDGAVEAHVEGPGDAVAALEAWAGEGPEHAAVASVEGRDAEPEGLRTFEIRQ